MTEWDGRECSEQSTMDHITMVVINITVPLCQDVLSITLSTLNSCKLTLSIS